MPDVLALPILHDAVQARFASEGATCAFGFGWRQPALQVTGPRIVVVPGDELGTFASEIGAPKKPGQNPRGLANVPELFHVVVSTADLADAENERVQYIACRLLLDAWIRAAVLEAGPRLRYVSGEWLTDREARRYGASLITVWTLDAVVPDVPFPEGALTGLLDMTSVRGLADVTMLDVTTQVETKPAPVSAYAVTRVQTTLSDAQEVDGVTPAPASVVLVAEQDDATENGLYTVGSGAWARTADTLASGLSVTASNGDSAPSLYRLTTADPITPDVTAQTWTRITPEASP